MAQPHPATQWFSEDAAQPSEQLEALYGALLHSLPVPIILDEVAVYIESLVEVLTALALDDPPRLQNAVNDALQNFQDYTDEDKIERLNGLFDRIVQHAPQET